MRLIIEVPDGAEEEIRASLRFAAQYARNTALALPLRSDDKATRRYAWWDAASEINIAVLSELATPQ